MARHRLPPPNELWLRHETLYIGIFQKALVILKAKKVKLKDEDSLSERLCPILTSICYEHSKRKNREIRTPDWENPKQPITDDELLKGELGKRPDFTCKLCNPQATDAETFEIALDIECKCLGKPSGEKGRYIYTKNYISKGIMRFLTKTHGYGKRADSGIMIGYIISMKLDEILEEVNRYQSAKIPDNPSLSFCFDRPPVFRENQIINRKEITPHKFKLIHLWADLRN